LYKYINRKIEFVCRYSAIVNTEPANYIVMSRVLYTVSCMQAGILGYIYSVAMKSAAE